MSTKKGGRGISVRVSCVQEGGRLRFYRRYGGGGGRTERRRGDVEVEREKAEVSVKSRACWF